MVYRHYDQAGLDSEYRGEVVYRKRDEMFTVTKNWSAEVRESIPYRSDIAYGAHRLAKFDLFPAATTGGPVVLFYHGGYWRRNDKADFSCIAPIFVKTGISVAVMNYPLAPAATMDVIVQQMRASIAYIAQHAGELGVDSRRIYVTGHSAGGHLTAMAMETDWSDYDLDFDPVRGACAISGLYDLLPLKLCNLNDIIHMDTETAYRNSPVHFVSRIDREKWRERKILLSVGGGEPYEYHEQQRDFARALKDRGLSFEVIPNAADTHAEIMVRLAEGSVLTKAVVAMVKRDG
jgi:arylformamidase